jgi:flagellar motility protein MotE (MotC chaperone)
MRQSSNKRAIRTGIFLTLSASCLALAACSDSGDPAVEAPAQDVATEQASSLEADRASAPAEARDSVEGEAGEAAVPTLGEIPVTMPKLAYAYDYLWRMPAAEIGSLQRRHATLCEQQGAGVCQILAMNKTGEEAQDVAGVLQMAVAAPQARAFGALLEDEAEDAGAEQVSAEITSDELSKQIVDTQARLAARTELRDRLLEVLKTRKGTVQELVEAERSVAQVNEELDQAKSWLKEMEGRVAYSKVTVRYETGTPVSSDFLGPVQSALGSLGTILGYLVAILIVLGAIFLPIGAILWGVRRATRALAAPVQEGG